MDFEFKSKPIDKLKADFLRRKKKGLSAFVDFEEFLSWYNTQKLKDLFEINEIYFVPVEKGDWLGHIDSMARFISSDTLLINDYSKEKQGTYVDFLSALHNAKLNWITFPFNPYNNNDDNDATGVYLNYLELDKFIILPVFGIDTDKSAIRKAKEIFSQKTIIPVKSNQPAKDNGIINCLTWNIKKCNHINNRNI